MLKVRLAIAGFMVLIAGAAIYSSIATPALPEQYELVRMCDAPLMRRARDRVVKRVSDGKLFLERDGQQRSPIEEGRSLNDICRRPGLL